MFVREPEHQGSFTILPVRRKQSYYRIVISTTVTKGNSSTLASVALFMWESQSALASLI